MCFVRTMRGRLSRKCQEVLAFNERVFKTYIGPAFEVCRDDARCIIADNVL